MPSGNVAELFAGVGGFRLGLSKSGWSTKFSNQWEPSTKVQHASEVYVARFGAKGHTNQDISTVDRIPVDFDLLVGGFPCQDYSVAKSLKSATGLEGKKGVLWWEILRLINVHRPKFIFLENVDRLLKSPAAQRGRDFAVMLSTLGSAGYVVEWRVANAADYGFPQRRVRLFIVAKRSDFFPQRIDPQDQLFRSGVFARALSVVPNASGIAEVLLGDAAVAISQTFNHSGTRTPFANAGIYFDGVAYTTIVKASPIESWMTLGDIVVDDSMVPDEYWVPDEKLADWAYLKGAKRIDRVHKESGFLYKYSEGKIAFPDHLDRPSRTVVTGEGGSTPSRFKHVVRTKKGFRRLTPVELERLCGFPDGWTNPPGLEYGISDGRRAFFMGNALVVGLVELIGKVLADDHKSSRRAKK
jgi:DNA (cytosine-5)-methyltransferase 1